MQTAVPLVECGDRDGRRLPKFFEYDGRRYSHIIDPATGRPVEHTLASVTVVADTCIAADGWDTPLLVLGPERGFECAEKNGIAAMFISHCESGDEGGIGLTTCGRRRRGESGLGLYKHWQSSCTLCCCAS